MDGTQHSMTDSDLDRELESALGVEPSPEFLARVRTRIACEPEASPWRLAFVVSGVSRTRRNWVVDPLWAVAMAGIVLAVVIPGWMRKEIPTRPGSAVVASRDADRELLPDIQKPVPSALGVRPVRTVRRPEATETPLRLSAVLFSQDERRALQRLVMAVEEGLVPPLPETVHANDQSGDVRLPRIEPLLIEPLPQLARLEEFGVSQ